MSTKIKICGLRRIEDVDFVNEAKPDYAGVILCRRFWRGIDFEQAYAIRKRLDPNIPLVGVFVNDRFSDVVTALRQRVVDIVQLHGTESEEYISSLKVLNRNITIIKACQMHSSDVVQYAENTCAEQVLLDFGHGVQNPDFNLARNVKRDFFLSGGITPDKIPAIINELHPWGIDISSGVEDVVGSNYNDRVKSRDKILAAVEAVRKFG